MLLLLFDGVVVVSVETIDMIVATATWNETFCDSCRTWSSAGEIARVSAVAIIRLSAFVTEMGRVLLTSMLVFGNKEKTCIIKASRG